jgi:hypothetical protein
VLKQHVAAKNYGAALQQGWDFLQRVHTALPRADQSSCLQQLSTAARLNVVLCTAEVQPVQLEGLPKLCAVIDCALLDLRCVAAAADVATSAGSSPVHATAGNPLCLPCAGAALMPLTSSMPASSADACSRCVEDCCVTGASSHDSSTCPSVTLPSYRVLCHARLHLQEMFCLPADCPGSCEAGHGCQPPGKQCLPIGSGDATPATAAGGAYRSRVPVRAATAATAGRQSYDLHLRRLPGVCMLCAVHCCRLTTPPQPFTWHTYFQQHLSGTKTVACCAGPCCCRWPARRLSNCQQVCGTA